MSSQDQLLITLDKNYHFIREQIVHGEFKNAVEGCKLLANYMSVKVKELGEENEENK
jgi:hypothetical protein